jgi:hypothetical protein
MPTAFGLRSESAASIQGLARNPKIMIAHMKSTSRFALFTAALAALGFAFVQSPSARASNSAALAQMDDKAPSLPVTSSFEKVADADNGPYVLSLKNTSGAELKVTAKVLLSVYFHDDLRSRNIPEHAIAAGEVWTINRLAAQDKVTVSAKGFAPLELTVP